MVDAGLDAWNGVDCQVNAATGSAFRNVWVGSEADSSGAAAPA